MLRKFKISTRLAFLILMMISLVVITTLGFYFGLDKIKAYYSTELKSELTAIQKDKIKIDIFGHYEIEKNQSVKLMSL